MKNQKEKREEFLKKLKPETRRLFLAKLKDLEEEGTFEIEWYGDQFCLTSPCFKGCIGVDEALLLSYIADFTLGGGWVSNAERCKVGTKYMEVGEPFVELWPRVRLHKASLVNGLAKLRETYLFGDFDVALGFNPRNKVVVDIGAWVGEFAIRAARQGAKKVYALEPNPYAFEHLKENADLSEVEVEALNAQIGPKGTVEFRVPKLMLETSPEAREVVTIDSIPLKDLLDVWGVEEGDYIKITCSVKSLLRGDIEPLKRFDYIVVEYSKAREVFEILKPALRRWKYKFALFKPYPYVGPSLSEKGVVVARRA